VGEVMHETPLCWFLGRSSWVGEDEDEDAGENNISEK